MAALFAGTAIVGALYGARAWMPTLASRHGAGIDSMLNYLLVTVGALFVAGYLALADFIWRGSRRDAIGPRFASRRTEILLSTALGVGMAIVAEGGVVARAVESSAFFALTLAPFSIRSVTTRTSDSITACISGEVPTSMQ